MSHLHNLRVPIVHGDFKASDVLVQVDTHQTKITNFGLHDFKGFMIRATLPGEEKKPFYLAYAGHPLGQLSHSLCFVVFLYIY